MIKSNPTNRVIYLVLKTEAVDFFGLSLLVIANMFNLKMIMAARAGGADFVVLCMHSV